MFNRNLSSSKKLKFPVLGLILIIAFYLFNGINYLRSQSITSDEGSFYNYAVRYAQRHPERINPISDNSKMPVILLNIIPRAIEQVQHPGLKKTDDGKSDIVAGRYITLLFSVFIILFVFVWAKELYGVVSGVFAAFLISVCPNNLANAALVTTDSYSVLYLLITIYYLWKFCNYPSYKNFLLFSLFTALSQLVKQSLFHLYILIPIILIVHQLNKRQPVRMKMFLSYFFIFILVNWLIINAGYYFYRTNEALGSYHFMSNLFQQVQQVFPSWLPLPFPKPFVDGLDMTKYYDQLGGGYYNISSFGKVTILGHSATGGSFWYYYFVSLFYKTPITYLILFFTSLFLLFRTTTLKRFLEKEFFLLCPVLYFLFLFSFFYKTQCGIRHAIFIFPLSFIFSSRIILFTTTVTSKLTVAALCIFLVISISFYWKNYFPYTNEFIYDKKMAYAYVGASNLEFSQGNYFFKEYLSKHPEVKPVPLEPETGIFLINTEDYLDIWNLYRYDWLSRIKPCGVVAYNGLLIKAEAKDIPDKHN